MGNGSSREEKATPKSLKRRLRGSRQELSAKGQSGWTLPTSEDMRVNGGDGTNDSKQLKKKGQEAEQAKFLVKDQSSAQGASRSGGTAQKEQTRTSAEQLTSIREQVDVYGCAIAASASPSQMPQEKSIHQAASFGSDILVPGTLLKAIWQPTACCLHKGHCQLEIPHECGYIDP